jgi:fumarate reductase flavoprotein subunit
MSPAAPVTSAILSCSSVSIDALSGMRDADAIVIGAGAAGMMGALAAAQRGASVLLLEKDLAGPSNLLVSGGLFPGAGTRWQRAAGIDDSGPAFARDIRAKGGATTNETIVEAVAARTADAAHFLADAAGIDVHLAAAISAPGHAVARLHATPAESGRELHALMRAAVARQPRIEVLDRIEIESLDGDFSVKTNVKTFGARCVLLGTGGFAGNAQLLREFIPAVADAIHIGAGPNDGCAIAWGRALGATLAQMDGYQGQGHVNPGRKTRLGMGLPLLGAFIVNRDGERFVREDVGPSELGALVLAQPGGVALEVFDQRIHDTAMRQGPYREAWAAGAIMTAQSAEALAAMAGLPGDLAIEDMRSMARSGSDPLGRTRFGPPLEAPFYAAWVTGALAHTQGGLAVDARARVVRADGSAIDGLFASGGAAAGLAGRGGEGYLPGNGLAQSFALSLIAGEEIALLGRRA